MFTDSVLHSFRYPNPGPLDPRLKATALRVLAFKTEYGRWPNADEYAMSVKSARDPWVSAPLRYLTTETGFKVYTVGQNGKDDGGIWKDRTTLDDYFFEFPIRDSEMVPIEIVPPAR